MPLLPVLLYLTLVLVWSIFTKPSANAMLLRDAMSLLTSSCFFGSTFRNFSRWGGICCIFRHSRQLQLQPRVANLRQTSLSWPLSGKLGTLVRLLMQMPFVDLYANENTSGSDGLIGTAVVAAHGVVTAVDLRS